MAVGKTGKFIDNQWCNERIENNSIRVHRFASGYLSPIREDKWKDSLTPLECPTSSGCQFMLLLTQQPFPRSGTKPWGSCRTAMREVVIPYSVEVLAAQLFSKIHT